MTIRFPPNREQLGLSARGPVRQTEPVADCPAGGTYVQLARFVVVGSASVSVDLGVYALLTAFSPLAWSLAKGISYAAGVIVGFFGNKFWTFESPRRSAAEPAMYLLLYAGTLLLNMGCHQLALTTFGPKQKLLAFLFATGVTMITNFLGMKYVAFRRGIETQHRLQPQNPLAEMQNDHCKMQNAKVSSEISSSL